MVRSSRDADIVAVYYLPIIYAQLSHRSRRSHPPATLVRTWNCETILHVHHPINRTNTLGATRPASFDDVCISSGLAIPIEIQARCLSRRCILYVCVDGVNMPTESASSHHGDPTRTTATSQPGDPPFSTPYCTFDDPQDLEHEQLWAQMATR